MKKGKEEFDLSELIGGTLNIFGLKLDLAKLLSSPEDARGQLQELRERLKKLGGKEVLTDEEWARGAATISGYLRTRGILGDREYHIGTSAGPTPQARPKSRERARPAPPLEAVEPSLDVFDEPQQVTIIAEVPGTGLEDLDLKAEGNRLSLATRPTARRAYRKVVELSAEVEPESLQANCRNGVLEIHLRKKAGEDLSL